MSQQLKVLFIGDPHFKINNIKETDEMTAGILSLAEEKKPDLIVNLGDTLDRHESIHVIPLTRATEFIKKLTEIAPTYVIIGNHDRKNNRDFCSNEHPFLALKYWENCVVIDDTFKTTINGFECTFVPYVPPGRFLEALNHVTDWENSTFIAAHQEFYGVQMGAVKSLEGDKWDESLPLVITGHIHDFHQLQSNILYTGTPIQHTYGDRDNKTISIITFNESGDNDHERFSLDVTKKKTVNINVSEIDDYKPPSNCDLKIVISGTTSELKGILRNPKILQWKKKGFKIIHKDIPLDGEEIINRPTKGYKKELWKRIRKDDVMKEIYKKLLNQ